MSDNAKEFPVGMCPESEAVFAAFGRVAYSVQIFEADLITLLILLEQIPQIEEAVKSDPELFLNKQFVEKRWLKNIQDTQGSLDKLTLGQLLKDRFDRSRKNLQNMIANREGVFSVERLGTISKQLDGLPIAAWSNALCCRNDLFHRFWYNNDDKLIDNRDCEALQAKLEKIQREFANHVNSIRDAINSIMEIMGYEQNGINLT